MQRVRVNGRHDRAYNDSRSLSCENESGKLPRRAVLRLKSLQASKMEEGGDEEDDTIRQKVSGSSRRILCGRTKKQRSRNPKPSARSSRARSVCHTGRESKSVEE